MTTETQNPLLVSSGPDMGIRRGGGMESVRPVISYANMVEGQKLGKGAGLVKFAIVMRAPEHDTPGAGPPVAMPAEKSQKWYAQGYRHCEGTPLAEGGYDVTLVTYHTDTTPRRWVQSMIEDAIALGEPIPEEMRPVGYTGPTFELRPELAGVGVEAPVYDIPAPVIPNLEHLNAEGLKTYADEHGIELTNRLSVRKMRAEIAVALGIVEPTEES